VEEGGWSVTGAYIGVGRGGGTKGGQYDDRGWSFVGNVGSGGGGWLYGWGVGGSFERFEEENGQSAESLWGEKGGLRSREQKREELRGFFEWSRRDRVGWMVRD